MVSAQAVTWYDVGIHEQGSINQLTLAGTRLENRVSIIGKHSSEVQLPLTLA